MKTRSGVLRGFTANCSNSASRSAKPAWVTMVRHRKPPSQTWKTFLRIFGKDFVDQVRAMGIKQVLSAPRSPWQRAYVERVIGAIRRECLDHTIVFNEHCLYRHLKSFVDYYHRSRTHLALEKDSPEPRPIQPPASGRIIAIPVMGGLHHRYERRAA